MNLVKARYCIYFIDPLIILKPILCLMGNILLRIWFFVKEHISRDVVGWLAKLLVHPVRSLYRVVPKILGLLLGRWHKTKSNFKVGDVSKKTDINHSEQIDAHRTLILAESTHVSDCQKQNLFRLSHKIVSLPVTRNSKQDAVETD